jgi:Cu/Ag efflux protein CusF
LTSGEVTKLDRNAGRVTLKHGEIKNLDMPPMTMTYRAADPKWLDNVAVGDRVRFAAERVGGQFTVTALSKAP